MPFQYVNKCDVTDTLLPHGAAEVSFPLRNALGRFERSLAAKGEESRLFSQAILTGAIWTATFRLVTLLRSKTKVKDLQPFCHHQHSHLHSHSHSHHRHHNHHHILSHHAKKAGPPKKVSSSCCVSPILRYTLCRIASCPVKASGRLMPFSAIQSISRRQRVQFHQTDE